MTLPASESIVPLSEPWRDVDPRHLSDGGLSDALKRCAPGSDLHRALLGEQRRRRERTARLRAAVEA